MGGAIANIVKYRVAREDGLLDHLKNDLSGFFFLGVQ